MGRSIISVSTSGLRLLPSRHHIFLVKLLILCVVIRLMTHAQEGENTIMMPKKKVFVSYARKDSTSAEVGELVRWLSGQEGIEIISDHLHLYRAPPQGWYTWMQRSIDDADIVLCICGEAFKKGFEKRGGGKGVAFEGDIITADLYESGGWNEKFHPILPEMGAHRYVPKKLRPWDNGIALVQRENILCLIRQEQTDKQVFPDTLPGTSDNSPDPQVEESIKEYVAKGDAAGDRWQSSWFNLKTPMSFKKSERLLIKVEGGAENVLVRLLPRNSSPNSFDGIEGTVRKVPAGKVLDVKLERDHPNVKQISVHAGREAWGVPLGGNNGTVRIVSIEYSRR